MFPRGIFHYNYLTAPKSCTKLIIKQIYWEQYGVQTMESIKTTPSQENYIEWIYRLSQKGPVRPAQLAEKLGVTRPSATRAVASLAEKKLVQHKSYGDIRLTEEGKALGRAIVRRDDCLTDLLVTVLGMSPQDAAPEIHRLEHVVSEEVLTRLEVLVRFASSSHAWLKRLRLRIDNAMSRPSSRGAFLAGCHDVHKGDPSKKAADVTIEDEKSTG
jgi:DtxR family Mn-dependent transcriptional regulator